MPFYADPEKDKTIDSSATTLGGGATSSGVTQAPSEQGSGQFINIQSYLDSNKQAGDQLSGRIGQHLQSGRQEKRDVAQGHYGDLQGQLGQARQTLGQGSQYLGQLRNIGQNIEDRRGSEGYGQGGYGIRDFSKGPEYGQFQNIRSGSAIDERGLGDQYSEGSRHAADYRQSALGAESSLGSNRGREQLLGDVYSSSNPGYSRGSASFDNLFLGGQGLRDLRQDTGEAARTAEQFARQFGGQADQVRNVADRERDLLNRIDEQTSSNASNFLNVLGSHAGAVNTQRDAEWKALNDAVRSYGEGGGRVSIGLPGTETQAGGLTSEQLERLGLDSGPHRTYNVLPGLEGASDIARQGRSAQGYRDVASGEDVSRYAELAKLAGIDPLSLQEGSNIGSAYSAIEGDNSLASRLSQAEEAFNQNAADTTFERTVHGGGDTYYGRAGGTGTDLIAGGIDALNRTRGGIPVTENNQIGLEQSNQARDLAFEDFLSWLEQTGYDNTIGG